MTTLRDLVSIEKDKQKMLREIKAISGYEDPSNLPSQKKQVVEEEQFVCGLEKIITRDFFPELLQIRQYKQWKMKQEQAQDDFFSQQSDAEFFEDSEVSRQEDFDKDVKNLSLNQYVAKYTSQDNHSFSKLVQEDRDKFLAKYSWLFAPHLEAGERLLALQQSSDNKLQNMIGSAPSNNMIEYARPQPMSALMFKDNRLQVQSYSTIGSEKQKIIDYQNTRLPRFYQNRQEGVTERDDRLRLESDREIVAQKMSKQNLRGLLPEQFLHQIGGIQGQKFIKGSQGLDDRIYSKEYTDNLSSSASELRTKIEAENKTEESINFTPNLKISRAKKSPRTPDESIGRSQVLGLSEREAVAESLTNSLLGKRSASARQSKATQMQKILTPIHNSHPSAARDIIKNLSVKLLDSQRQSSILRTSLNTGLSKTSARTPKL